MAPLLRLPSVFVDQSTQVVTPLPQGEYLGRERVMDTEMALGLAPDASFARHNPPRCNREKSEQAKAERLHCAHAVISFSGLSPTRRRASRSRARISAFNSRRSFFSRRFLVRKSADIRFKSSMLSAGPNHASIARARSTCSQNAASIACQRLRKDSLCRGAHLRLPSAIQVALKRPYAASFSSCRWAAAA